MHDPIWLRSERLGLRRFTLDDLEALVRMYSDPEVTRYVGGQKDRAKAEEMLRGRILEYYDQHPGLGIWAGVELATGACTGMHLLNHINGEPDIQVGYVLFKEFWGRGYATEMALRLLRYGFCERKLPRIVAITDLDHEVSQRVLTKVGLRRKGERSLANYGESPLAWFERDAADWLAWVGDQPSSPST
jgi:[ribosomal protein S5]-alanine N-acetyltransferase